MRGQLGTNTLQQRPLSKWLCVRGVPPNYQKILALAIFILFGLSLLGSHKVLAVAPDKNSLPNDIANSLQAYDNPNNGGSNCLASSPQQYSVNNWISPQNDTTNDSSIQPNGNGTWNLQLNELVFLCHTISSPSNAYYPPGNGVPASTDLTHSYEYINAASVSAGNFVSSPQGTTLTINRNANSRFWFADQTFQYSYSGSLPRTITITLNVRPINDFNGTYICVDHRNGQVVYASGPNDSNCPSNDVNFTILLAPPPQVTISGSVTETSGASTHGINQSPEGNSAYIQECNCGGSCNNISIDSNGNFSFQLDEWSTFCLYVRGTVSSLDGSATLNPSYGPSGGAYQNQIAYPPTNNYYFEYFLPKGNLETASCTQIDGWADSPDPNISPQANPSQNPVTVQLSVNGYGTYNVIANQVRYTGQTNEFIMTHPPYGNAAGSTTVTANILANGQSYYIGQLSTPNCNQTKPNISLSPSCMPNEQVTVTASDADSPNNGAMAVYYSINNQSYSSSGTTTFNIDMSGYDQRNTYTIYAESPGLGGDGGTGTGGPWDQEQVTYGPCDFHAPAATITSLSCNTGNATFTATDSDNQGSVQAVITIDGGSQTYTTDSSGNITVNMTGHDQLIQHSVNISVADRNINGSSGPGGFSTATASGTYPPCYQATCGQASVAGEVEVNSGSFSATITLGFNSLNGAPNPPPKTIGGTLSDAFNGQPGSPPSINNYYVLTSSFAVPGNAADYNLSWTFNDPGPGAVGLPISCGQNVVVGDQPYLRTYGGDVTSSEGFGSTCTQTAAGIIGWNEGSSGGYAGAGTQFAALALGQITGFISSDGAAAGVPTGLSVSNQSGVGNDNYGGNAQLASSCLPDYYSAPVSAAATVYNCSSSVTINASKANPLSACQLQQGTAVASLQNLTKPTVIKVNGNATLTGSGPSYSLNGPWVNYVNQTTTTNYNGPIWGASYLTAYPPSYETQASQIPAGQIGFVWTYANGSVVNDPSYSCIDVNEPSDPIWATYDDNRLCVPRSTGISLYWTYYVSVTGLPGGWTCMLVNPLSEPPQNYWNDNYLCYYAGGRDLGLFISYTGPVTGAFCTQMNEPGDGDGGYAAWEQIYLCEPRAGTPARPATGGSPWTNVVGRVTFTNGQGIGGVQVCFCDWYASGTYCAVSAMTDANGYYNAYPFYTQGGGASLCIRVNDTSQSYAAGFPTPAIPPGYGPTAVNDPPEEAGSGSYECQFPGANEYQPGVGGCGGISSWDINSDDYYDFTFPTPPTVTVTRIPNTDSLAIPNLYVVAKGNIYIDPNITSMSGVYVAEPNGSSGGTIYTCGVNPSSSYYATCNHQLEVDGAFVAKQVAFGRTWSTANRGSPGDTVLNRSNGWNNAAEVFNYTPAIWLENPFTMVSPTYDAITSLPPIL